MAMPRTDPAAAADGLAALERLWYEMEPPEGVRVELIDGEIVVSPTGSVRHSTAIDKLMDQLVDLKRRRGWIFHTYLTVHIPATRERLIPDLMVTSADAPSLSECELLAPGVLLVAEVVSPWSRRRDREQKPRAYAQGGVPLYVLVDRFDKPSAVTLYSQRGEHGYGKREVAAAGEALRLPKPFGIALDTARLLG